MRTEEEIIAELEWRLQKIKNITDYAEWRRNKTSIFILEWVLGRKETLHGYKLETKFERKRWER